MGRPEASPSYRFAVSVLRPVLRVVTERDWAGVEHLPRDRGFVVVTNHISYSDPLTVAHFLYDNGFLPRFLGKEQVFRVPGVGAILRGAGQIPVFRESGDAQRAFAAAVEAVEAGECVVIYPEGTLTRDPGLWPMRGKTGAARVALQTGCPVVPVAQWGPQELLPPYGRRPRLWPATPVRVHAGPPVDLSRFSARRVDGTVLQQATDAILDDLTALVSRLRREEPPQVRWDPRLHGQPTTGNPARTRRRKGRS
ncbi:lysophospholipid acyltransferase family protein [Thalassiella azotivora]